MLVSQFKIVSHGIGDVSSTYGKALLVRGEWRSFETGKGLCRFDAADDAIDKLAQRDWDFGTVKSAVSLELDEALKSLQLKWLVDLRNLREQMGCHCEGDGCAMCEGSDLQWYVTIYVK